MKVYNGDDVEHSNYNKLLANAKSYGHLAAKRCSPSYWNGNGVDLQRLHVVQRCTTLTGSYARGCVNDMSNPRIMKFFAEPSPKLDLANYLIGDDDLQSVLDALLAPQFGMGPSLLLGHSHALRTWQTR